MIRFRSRTSSLLLNLALLAFLVRSFIPVGFMPGLGAGHEYPLVICSGHGPMTIHVPADKLPSAPAPAPHNHEMPCSYAQAFAQGTPADSPVLPASPAAETVLAAAETILFPNIAVKNYFSRGPPAFPA